MEVNGLLGSIPTAVVGGLQTLSQKPYRYSLEEYQGFYREEVGGRWVSKKG